MNKSKSNYMKRNTGITLISLVVTIIILIILAGISINLVLGENGVIQKAKQSKVAQTEAEVKEKVEMILAEYAMEREFNNKTLLTFLEENNQIDTVTDNEDGTYTLEVDGYAVTINIQKLNITEIGKPGLKPIVSNIKITTDGTTEVTDKVITGTPLIINFEHSINGGTTTVDKTLPYTTDGTETEVTFVVTGIVNGKKYTKTVIVSLEDKYKIAQLTNKENCLELYGYTYVKTNIQQSDFIGEGKEFTIAVQAKINRDEQSKISYMDILGNHYAQQGFVFQFQRNFYKFRIWYFL